MWDQTSTEGRRVDGVPLIAGRRVTGFLPTLLVALALYLSTAISSAQAQAPQPSGSNAQSGKLGAQKSQSYEVGHMYIMEWATVALFSGLAIFAVGRSSRRN